LALKGRCLEILILFVSPSFPRFIIFIIKCFRIFFISGKEWFGEREGWREGGVEGVRKGGKEKGRNGCLEAGREGQMDGQKDRWRKGVRDRRTE
jgi:hypothetical protein